MTPSEKYLSFIAYEIRRLSIITTTQAGSGHPTSCLSAAEIMAVVFFDLMKQEDTFILSKGHAAPALYAVYYLLDCITYAELMTLRQWGSRLEGHPTPHFPYTPVATGSLGQGLSVAIGQLLAARLMHKTSRCFVLMGDSETTEGSVWEAAELASYYGLSNVVVFIDANGLGQTSRTIDSIATYARKFESFGWQTHTLNGNNLEELIKLGSILESTQKPLCVIAHTVKGYGVPSVQNKENFHGKPFKQQDLLPALEELKNFFPEASLFKPSDFNVSTSPRCVINPQHTSKKIEFKMPYYSNSEPVSTRKAFGKSLEYAGSLSEKIVSLDAEVNNSTYATFFAQAYPQRFFQAFVAEQNMIGMAAGLASQGFIPFASTFAAFLTRAYDQLRMSAISRLPLRVVGSHCGVSIGADGPSQMGLEDIALFRTLPDSIILYPCDAVSTYRCVEIMINQHESITYLRTTRAETPVVYDNATEFIIGGCHILKQSPRDIVTIIAAGITLFEALKAHERLAAEAILTTIIDCYSIKPLPIDAIIQAACATGHRIVIVEDHYAAGGLGEAVIAALAEHAPAQPWDILPLAVTKLPRSGAPEELLAFESIDAQAVYAAIKENFVKKS